MQSEFLPKYKAASHGAQDQDEVIIPGVQSGGVVLKVPELPPPDLVHILGKAQAYMAGTINFTQAHSEVERHHIARATTAILKSSDEPLGVETAARTLLTAVKTDLASAQKVLQGEVKYEERQVSQAPVLTPPEKAQMGLLVAASIGLSIFSVYGTMAFVSGSGILSGASAWGIALGPIAWAVVLKVALNTVGNDAPKRRAIQVMAGIVAFCALAWIATLAIEANASMAQSNSMLTLSPSTEQANPSSGWWLIVRAVAMMCIELLGAAVITDKFFDIWSGAGRSDGAVKVAVINPKFAAYDADKTLLLERQAKLEHLIGRIESWHAVNQTRIAEYKLRASAILDSNIALLKG
jgi:hypothetical protein